MHPTSPSANLINAPDVTTISMDVFGKPSGFDALFKKKS